MRTLLKRDAKSFNFILFILKRVRYAFVKRSRIAKAFFNFLLTYNVEYDVN